MTETKFRGKVLAECDARDLADAWTWAARGIGALYDPDGKRLDGEDARRLYAGALEQIETEVRARSICFWRPIDTAPYKKWVLLWLYLPKNPKASGVIQGQITDSETNVEDPRGGIWDGHIVRTNTATHWMPIPDAPRSVAFQPSEGPDKDPSQ
jgi:hypothetical protein